MMKTLLSIFGFTFLLLINSLQAQNTTPALAREPQLALYPQPANTQLTLSFDVNQAKAPKIMMYDLLGNLIAEMEAERTDHSAFSIYVGDRKPGYYFLKIYTEEGSYSRRITVKP